MAFQFVGSCSYLGSQNLDEHMLRQRVPVALKALYEGLERILSDRYRGNEGLRFVGGG